MFKINDVELEFNLYELETMKRYDDLINTAAITCNQIFNRNELNSYEKMQAQMKVIRKVFDKLFYAGAGEKICGTTNAMKHLSAYNELQKEAERLMDDYNKVSLEMQQRNAKTKKVLEDVVNSDDTESGKALHVMEKTDVPADKEQPPNLDEFVDRAFSDGNIDK